MGSYWTFRHTNSVELCIHGLLLNSLIHLPSRVVYPWALIELSNTLTQQSCVFTGSYWTLKNTLTQQSCVSMGSTLIVSYLLDVPATSRSTLRWKMWWWTLPVRDSSSRNPYRLSISRNTLPMIKPYPWRELTAKEKENTFILYENECLDGGRVTIFNASWKIKSVGDCQTYSRAGFESYEMIRIIYPVV